jgi:hypothetical protein
MEVINLKQKLR